MIISSSTVASGRKIDHTLTYRDVNFHSQEVGRIPNDIFLPTDQTPPLESLKKVRPVIVRQPEMSNGEPVVREISRRFQATAPSPVVGGLVGGFVGGVVGAVAGGFLSIGTGNGAFLIGGLALTGAVGAYIGAAGNASKEVQLVVSERPIESKTMTGIDTAVRAGTLKGQRGYFHSFSGRLERTHHGNYDVPRIQTVRADKS